MSSRSSTSRKSRRTCSRSNPFGANCCRRSSFTDLAGFAGMCPCSANQPKNRRSVHEGSIDCGDRLALVPPQVIPKIGDVPHGHPLHTTNGSRLAVVNHRANFRTSWAKARRVFDDEVVGVEVLGEEGRPLPRRPGCP